MEAFGGNIRCQSLKKQYNMFYYKNIKHIKMTLVKMSYMQHIFL
jgi:hypothetical protein